MRLAYRPGVRSGGGVGRRVPGPEVAGAGVEGGQVAALGPVGAVPVAVRLGRDDEVVVAQQVDGRLGGHHPHVVPVGLHRPAPLGVAARHEGGQHTTGAAGGREDGAAVGRPDRQPEHRPVDDRLPAGGPARGGVEGRQAALASEVEERPGHEDRPAVVGDGQVVDQPVAGAGPLTGLPVVLATVVARRAASRAATRPGPRGRRPGAAHGCGRRPTPR